MNHIKKTIYTLDVDNYAPEMTEITFPFMKRYADKIGAEFHVITDRRFPDAPPTYEKFQIYELAREHKNDWSIFFDADVLIHPDLLDVTSRTPKDTVVVIGTGCSACWYRLNEFSLRDGRYASTGNWFSAVSDWCLDYWHPLDIPLETAVKDIFISANDVKRGTTPRHMIDEYTATRNIARYGLKYFKLIDLDSASFSPLLMHHYVGIPTPEKVAKFRATLQLASFE